MKKFSIFGLTVAFYKACGRWHAAYSTDGEMFWLLTKRTC